MLLNRSFSKGNRCPALAKIIKAADFDCRAGMLAAMEYTLTEFNHRPAKGVLSEELAAPVEKSEAEVLLERASEKAAIILNTAQSEAQGFFEQAAADGYHAGIEQAKLEAEQHSQEISAQLAQLIERLDTAIIRAEQDRLDLLDSAEPAVVELVLESVRKVVKHEVKTDPSVVARNIKSCLRRIKDVHDVSIRVNPAELESVKSVRDELISCSECVHSVILTDDRRVGPGGCIVESASGDFDATIETQLERITSKIREIAADASDSEPR